MSNKSNKNRKLSQQHSQSSQPVQDFDLPQSFRKFSSYSKPSRRSNRHESTKSDKEKAHSYQGGAVSSSSEGYEQNTMGVSWESYSKLEDKFTSLSDKNDMEHTALRKELEAKIDKSSDGIRDEIKDLRMRIDKKVPKWFLWAAISTLVAIVGIIWLLSYQEVVKVPAELIKQDGRIEKVESELKEQKQLLDSISKNVKPLQKSKK
ncbi:MAG: hypothetical protein IJ588_01760 [Prevotella sp.]|nr:hypothetical protein [Prevotella sp.]